jgi:hypothetical protein
MLNKSFLVKLDAVITIIESIWIILTAMLVLLALILAFVTGSAAIGFSAVVLLVPTGAIIVIAGSARVFIRYLTRLRGRDAKTPPNL